MHYFAAPGLSGVPVSGLGSRVPYVLPDWYSRAQAAQRDLYRTANEQGGRLNALRMVTTAFQVNLNRLDIPNKRVAMDFLYREWLRAANPSRMLVFGTDMSPDDRIATTVLLWARSP